MIKVLKLSAAVAAAALVSVTAFVGSSQAATDPSDVINARWFNLNTGVVLEIYSNGDGIFTNVENPCGKRVYKNIRREGANIYSGSQRTSYSYYPRNNECISQTFGAAGFQYLPATDQLQTPHGIFNHVY